jgi:hypothetical protein
MRNPILLVAVLVVLLASTGIALAQEESEGIGVARILEKPGYAPYAITDEATGVHYVVDFGLSGPNRNMCAVPEPYWPNKPEDGNQEYLDSHVGYRNIVYGPVLEGYDPPVLSLVLLRHAPTGEQPDPNFQNRDQTVAEPDTPAA